MPDGIINYLALLGWNPGTTQEVFSRDELIKAFSLDKLTKSGAVFDLARLQWMNGQHLKRLKPDELSTLAQPFLPEAARGADRALVERALQTVGERVRYLSELPELLGFYFTLQDYEPALLVWKKSTPEKTRAALEGVMPVLSALDEKAWKDPKKLADALQGFTDTAGLSTGDVFWPVRVALTGLKASPGPQDVMWVLGKLESIKRLKKASAAV